MIIMPGIMIPVMTVMKTTNQFGGSFSFAVPLPVARHDVVTCRLDRPLSAPLKRSASHPAKARAQRPTWFGASCNPFRVRGLRV